jgi:hypothetical protein
MYLLFFWYFCRNSSKEVELNAAATLNENYCDKNLFVLQLNKKLLKGLVCNTQHNAEHCSAECRLCSVSFMLSVTYKPFVLNAVILNVVVPVK